MRAQLQCKTIWSLLARLGATAPDGDFDLLVQLSQLGLVCLRKLILVDQVHLCFAELFTGKDLIFSQLVHALDALNSFELVLEVIEQILYGVRPILSFHELANGVLSLLVCERYFLFELLNFLQFIDGNFP